MSQNPMIMVVSDCELPEEDTKQEQLVKELKSILEKYDMGANSLSIFDGDIYAQTNVDVVCPDCDEKLRLRDLDLDHQNGASARAKCDCGWTGRAVYRLIDLEENLKTESVEDMFDSGSCVSDQKLDVTYTPYNGTEPHFY